MRRMRRMGIVRRMRLMLRVQNSLIRKFQQESVLFAINHVLLSERLVGSGRGLGEIFHFRLTRNVDISLYCIPGKGRCCYTHRHEKFVGLHGWARSWVIRED